MKHLKRYVLVILLALGSSIATSACSIVYYIDAATGAIYVINNEDFWYDTEAYIQTEVANDKELARLWYGWNDFAQGGINSAGLFFDAAVTPDQKMPKGYALPKGNVGDRLLAQCKTVADALVFMEKEKMAVHQSHLMFGDATGRAVIVEWIDGERHIIEMEGNHLIATNYLLLKPEAGNHPCPRYTSIEERIKALDAQGGPKGFPGISNVTAGAMQLPRKLDNGKTLGTLYTSFIDITNMKMIFLPKLDNTKVIQFDLKKEFEKKRRIELD
jgi:choloylglycine hydrolase